MRKLIRVFGYNQTQPKKFWSLSCLFGPWENVLTGSMLLGSAAYFLTCSTKTNHGNGDFQISSSSKWPAFCELSYKGWLAAIRACPSYCSARMFSICQNTMHMTITWLISTFHYLGYSFWASNTPGMNPPSVTGSTRCKAKVVKRSTFTGYDDDWHGCHQRA